MELITADAGPEAGFPASGSLPSPPHWMLKQRLLSHHHGPRAPAPSLETRHPHVLSSNPTVLTQPPFPLLHISFRFGSSQMCAEIIANTMVPLFGDLLLSFIISSFIFSPPVFTLSVKLLLLTS